MEDSSVLRASFKAQLADQKWLYPLKLYELVFQKAVFPVEKVSIKPEPFDGNCQNLLKKVKGVVNEVVEGTDYVGLYPYLKLLSQVSEDNSFAEARLDASGEKNGTLCVGHARMIVDKLSKLNIKGQLAAIRKIGGYPFVHVAVVVQCRDGYVLLDPRQNPHYRTFALPFNAEVQWGEYYFKIAGPGDDVPIVQISDQLTLQWCLGLNNADDIVLKQYLMTCLSSFIPTAVYKEDGNALQTILVVPTKGKIVLKDYSHGDKRTLEIPQDRILSVPWLELSLRHFFRRWCFHSPSEALASQLFCFVQQRERVKRLFLLSHPDVCF